MSFEQFSVLRILPQIGHNHIQYIYLIKLTLGYFSNICFLIKYAQIGYVRAIFRHLAESAELFLPPGA